MAYDVYGVRFLLHAADLGVDYTSTATLGHLFLFAGQADVAEALAACRGVKSPEVAASVYRDCAGYVDGILRYLGANHVDSIDASDYEDATVVHDFNAQIPPELEERYSAVVEGGTLEHVFDVSTSFRNTMRMVQQGGHLILNMPVNNFPGHGFYQFSPELLFRLLSPRFGYRILDALVMDLYHPWPRWFRAADPATIGRRLQFRSHSRTVMYVLAERIGPVPEFSPPPMQSDYTTEWGHLGTQTARAQNRPTPATLLNSSPSPASVSALRTAITDRATAMARRIVPTRIQPAIVMAGRTLPTRIKRDMAMARRSLLARIQQSRRFRRLKMWVVWIIPRVGAHPHYAAARPGFEPVHEPWTAPAPQLPRRFHRESDLPPPRYGEP